MEDLKSSPACHRSMPSAFARYIRSNSLPNSSVEISAAAADAYRITGTDSWAPKAYCRRRAAGALCEGPLRQPPSLYLRYRSLPCSPLSPPPRMIHSLAQRPRGLQSTPEQSLITLPLVFPQRAHLVQARFQARIDRMVRHGSPDFSSLSLPHGLSISVNFIFS